MTALKSDNLLRATINKNFLIRVHESDKRDTSLVSAGQYFKVVGEKLAEKHFNKVLENGLDNYTFRLRRGLRIDFRGK